MDLHYHAGRTGPSGECGRVISKGCVVDLVNENTKEGGGLVVGIGLELGVELDDEGGGDRREQTGLCPLLVQANQDSMEN